MAEISVKNLVRQEIDLARRYLDSLEDLIDTTDLDRNDEDLGSYVIFLHRDINNCLKNSIENLELEIQVRKIK